jgi:hypothetical protein
LEKLVIPKPNNKASLAKEEILNLARKVNKGLTETSEERQRILELFEQLEKKNPTKKPLASAKVNAVWRLEYTTSDSILSRKGLKKVGPVLQTIDAAKLFAQNSETVSFFGIPIPRKVTAALTPISDSEV